MSTELEGLAALLAELADDFASNIDWSNGRSNYGDNEAWESAARQARELAASDALADLLAARDRRVRAEAWTEGFDRGFYDPLAGHGAAGRDASESAARNPYEADA